MKILFSCFYLYQIANKYDTAAESEVITWFEQLVGIKLEPGFHKLEKQLKNGQFLVKFDFSTNLISERFEHNTKLPIFKISSKDTKRYTELSRKSKRLSFEI